MFGAFDDQLLVISAWKWWVLLFLSEVKCYQDRTFFSVRIDQHLLSRVAVLCPPRDKVLGLIHVYNIAFGRGYVEEDLERVMREHLPEVPIEIGEPLDFAAVADKRRSHILDITLAREELGFSPQFDLNSGIDAIATWVRREKRHLS